MLLYQIWQSMGIVFIQLLLKFYNILFVYEL